MKAPGPPSAPANAFFARARSFRYAWAGLRAALRTEHNTYIHAALTAAAGIAGVALRISTVETVLLVFAAALVWMAELFNTAIETTADLISTEHHPQITLKKGLQRALRGRIGILRRELRIGCRDFQRESVVRTLSKKCSIVSTVFSHLSQKPLTSPSRSSHYI